MSKRIAIPKFKDSVAPCFETASCFLIHDTGKDKENASQIVTCSGCEGFGRIRLLQEKEIDVLICNGLKTFYLDLLKSSNVTVFDKVSMEVEEALRLYLRGQLEPSEVEKQLKELSCEIPHEDLVCWAKELFASHGYRIDTDEEKTPFPIDFSAEMVCPVCGKPVITAVCCGAHTYRADHEIKEFHHNAPSIYQAKVYVLPANPRVKECCDEYGIQLIDPDSRIYNSDKKYGRAIPLLSKPVTGHERAS
ncbi:MAG: hypothetical protein GF307_09870 [candidate division Zixibacteria bacterium]|nr:hypothetical protein [candidate division Zixibacteria bacterium]